MKNILATFCSFGVCLVLLFVLLPVLRKLKAGQQILCYVKEHSAKQGTPTMGGIAFVVAIGVCALIFCGVSDRTTIVAVAVFVAYAVIGFLDDFVKIRYKQNQGLKAYQKILFQLVVAVLVALYVCGNHAVGGNLLLPFSGRTINIGKWIIPFVVFIFVACTNGVNLTDGIDGLATSTTMCFLCGMIVLVGREAALCEQLGDTYAAEMCGNLVTVCWVGCGALAAFLLFNVNDAKVFMGDTGSLALGALVACVAIFARMSLFIPVVGLMYVVSCVSVIVQVVYFRLTHGKRVFLMAPYHHHLQHKGWSESRICVLYSLVTIATTLVLVCFGE